MGKPAPFLIARTLRLQRPLGQEETPGQATSSGAVEWMHCGSQRRIEPVSTDRVMHPDSPQNPT